MFDFQDIALLQRFRVYIQIAILNKRAESERKHSLNLAGVLMHMQTQMAWTQTAEELLQLFLKEMCACTGCEYVACYLPPVLGDLLRYDSTDPAKPVVLTLSEGSATHLVQTENCFLNATILRSKGGVLNTKDNFKYIERQWTKSQPTNISPACTQGLLAPPNPNLDPTPNSDPNPIPNSLFPYASDIHALDKMVL